MVDKNTTLCYNITIKIKEVTPMDFVNEIAEFIKHSVTIAWFTYLLVKDIHSNRKK